MTTPVANVNLPVYIVITHILYVMHAVSACTSWVWYLPPAGDIRSFGLSASPAIIAVVINYSTRRAVRGTFLDSHFSWQLRTFWFAILWVFLGVLTLVAFFFSGNPTLWATRYIVFRAIMVGFTWWPIYRILRGWITLFFRKPLPL